MAFTDLLFQRGSTPVLEAGMGFAYQQQVVTANNIANLETPQYTRQTLPEPEFRRSLAEAIEDRDLHHPSNFHPEGQLQVSWDGTYPRMRSYDGKENEVERHDENSVSPEQEMATLAKNELKMTAMQQFFRKGVYSIQSTAQNTH